MGLRIFSYLPNPRIWKATIAARLCGITIDIRGLHPMHFRSGCGILKPTR